LIIVDQSNPFAVAALDITHKAEGVTASSAMSRWQTEHWLIEPSMPNLAVRPRASKISE
jgi:hypothetical protein